MYLFALFCMKPSILTSTFAGDVVFSLVCIVGFCEKWLACACGNLGLGLQFESIHQHVCFGAMPSSCYYYSSVNILKSGMTSLIPVLLLFRIVLEHNESSSKRRIHNPVYIKKLKRSHFDHLTIHLHPLEEKKKKHLKTVDRRNRHPSKINEIETKIAERKLKQRTNF